MATKREEMLPFVCSVWRSYIYWRSHIHKRDCTGSCGGGGEVEKEQEFRHFLPICFVFFFFLCERSNDRNSYLQRTAAAVTLSNSSDSTSK